MNQYNQEKFLKIYSQQKHAIQIGCSKDRLSHTRELFKECKVFLVFMHQSLNIFKNPTHNYPKNFARTN